MRVLMIGIGDIARKGYLPVLATMPGIELHLCSRSVAALQESAVAYRIPHVHAGLDKALAATRFDAAFVHAATPAHGSIVRTLIEAGVPVHVDKPLADDLASVVDLLGLAEARGVLLQVGFNRRHAPAYAAMLEHDRTFMLMQKHRHAHPARARAVVFDDFIHVIDTLLFLAPTPPLRTDVVTTMRDGSMQGVTLSLGGDGWHAVGTMQRDAGLDEERLDVMGGGSRRSVLDLATTMEQAGDERWTRRGDWTSVADQRGFTAMCRDFLDGVGAGRTTDPTSILRTHELCERIVSDAEKP